MRHIAQGEGPEGRHQWHEARIDEARGDEVGQPYGPAGQLPEPAEDIVRVVRRQECRHQEPAYAGPANNRSEEHTSELQSLMRISYAVFCLKKKKQYNACTREDTHIST